MKKIVETLEHSIDLFEFPAKIEINTNTDAIVQVYGQKIILQRNSIYEITIQELKGD